MAFCTKCGKDVPEGLRFCDACGNPMTQEAAAAQARQQGVEPQYQAPQYQPTQGPYQQTAKSGLKGWQIALIVVGALLVLGFAGSLLIGGGIADSGMTVLAKDYSFKDGVLITPEYKIEITDYKIIPVGQKGNKYGDKPVIAFWYKVTNLTDEVVSPQSAWMLVFSAMQDNDPNKVSTLPMGALPDNRFLGSELQTIKKDETVESAWAYELSDDTTPVRLQAKKLFGSVIGVQTYEVK